MSHFCEMNLHKGEIIEKAVRFKEYPIALLAKKMNKSRRHVYDIFEKREISIEVIMKIGAIIQYDFSNDFKDILNLTEKYDAHLYQQHLSTIDSSYYWQTKYMQLLEQHRLLLAKELRYYFDKVNEVK